MGNQLQSGTRHHPSLLTKCVASLPWSCTCKSDVWWSSQSGASYIFLGQRFPDLFVHYHRPCWENGPYPAVGSTPRPTTGQPVGLCRWKTSCWVNQWPDVHRVSSKSQGLLVIGYLLVAISWLFRVPPYISPVFVINYSCSYCRGSRSAGSKEKALFLQATPCSTVTGLQRLVGEHNLEGSVEIWMYTTGKRTIYAFDKYYMKEIKTRVCSMQWISAISLYDR